MAPVNEFQAELATRMEPAEYAAWLRLTHRGCDYCRSIFRMTGQFHCPVHREGTSPAAGAAVLVAACTDTVIGGVSYAALVRETAESNPLATPGAFCWYYTADDGTDSWDGMEYHTIEGARDAFVMDAYCAMPQMDVSFQEVPKC